MTLPVSVMAPMMMDSAMVTADAAPPVTSAATVCSAVPTSTTSAHTTERATSAELAPPRPLRSATSSGISVISTRLAMMAPIRLPATRPPTIQR
jgi:hypothetical protein